ncbi:MAG: methylmalonyl-CoA epimerase [Chloroflexaceae bacterium]|nr:methylmalonyl-CoA epimerase [Chloroflexaceae bacterium]NJO06427.1 methylmalonyl-CoA epimerase [Chloroflexaceae bacterium]
MFSQVDHIGLAVSDIEQAIAHYSEIYGVTEWERIPMPERHMAVAAARVGELLIELIAPTSEEAAFAKYLKDKGAGVHHIAYRVADIHASLNELKDKGVRLIDETPRPGIHNTLIAFVHPKNGGQGVLVELVQHQDHH